ncbi:hypothetical protein ACLK1T_22460 [Escherichia coli]
MTKHSSLKRWRGTVANNPDDSRRSSCGEWLMADGKNQRANMLVVGLSANVPADPRRWMFYRRRYCVCVKCSVFAAVSGLHSTKR